MYVVALRVELRSRQSLSLKDKRAAIRPILEGARNRFQVSSAEVGHQNSRQLATLAFAAVSGSAAHLTEVIDSVERFVWSFPEVEVLESDRSWLE